MKKEGEDLDGINKWRGAIKIKVLSIEMLELSY